MALLLFPERLSSLPSSAPPHHIPQHQGTVAKPVQQGVYLVSFFNKNISPTEIISQVLKPDAFFFFFFQYFHLFFSCPFKNTGVSLPGQWHLNIIQPTLDQGSYQKSLSERQSSYLWLITIVWIWGSRECGEETLLPTLPALPRGFATPFKFEPLKIIVSLIIVQIITTLAVLFWC